MGTGFGLMPSPRKWATYVLHSRSLGPMSVLLQGGTKPLGTLSLMLKWISHEKRIGLKMGIRRPTLLLPALLGWFLGRVFVFP